MKLCECTAGEYRETCPVLQHARMAYAIRKRREHDPIGTGDKERAAFAAQRVFNETENMVLTIP